MSDVIGRRMETDERIVVLGEDVNRLKGGTNGATKRALELFPERVLGTPITHEEVREVGRAFPGASRSSCRCPSSAGGMETNSTLPTFPSSASRSSRPATTI